MKRGPIPPWEPELSLGLHSSGERKSISETGQLSESDVTGSVCEITLRLAPLAPEVLPRSTAIYILI